MKRLDGNSLFSIFEKGDEQIYKDLGVEDQLDNTFVLFGMVVKGVENFYIIDQMYSHRYGQSYDSVRDSIKLRYFVVLSNYLRRIAEFDSYTAHAILDEFGQSAIMYCLEHLLYFFEKKEYYENCALVKKYLDIFDESSLSFE